MQKRARISSYTKTLPKFPSDMKVSHLQTALRNLNQKTTGKKEVLVARLTAALYLNEQLKQNEASQNDPKSTISLRELNIQTAAGKFAKLNANILFLIGDFAGLATVSQFACTSQHIARLMSLQSVRFPSRYLAIGCKVLRVKRQRHISDALWWSIRQRVLSRIHTVETFDFEINDGNERIMLNQHLSCVPPMSKLTSLSLKGIANFLTPACILKSLQQCPSLCSISLISWRELCKESLGELALIKSFDALRSLEIHFADGDKLHRRDQEREIDSWFEQLISYTPRLETMSLPTIPSTAHILSSLTYVDCVTPEEAMYIPSTVHTLAMICNEHPLRTTALPNVQQLILYSFRNNNNVKNDKILVMHDAFPSIRVLSLKSVYQRLADTENIVEFAQQFQQLRDLYVRYCESNEEESDEQFGETLQSLVVGARFRLHTQAVMDHCGHIYP